MESGAKHAAEEGGATPGALRLWRFGGLVRWKRRWRSWSACARQFQAQNASESMALRGLGVSTPVLPVPAKLESSEAQVGTG